MSDFYENYDEDFEEKRNFLPLFVNKLKKNEINMNVVESFCDNNERKIISLQENEAMRNFLGEFVMMHRSLVSKKIATKAVLASITKQIAKTPVNDDNFDKLQSLYTIKARLRNTLSQKSRALANQAKYMLLKEICSQNDLNFSREKLSIFARNLFGKGIKESSLEKLIQEINMVDNLIKIRENVVIGYITYVEDGKETDEDVYEDVEIMLKNNELFDYYIKNHLDLPNFQNFLTSIKKGKALTIDFFGNNEHDEQQSDILEMKM